MNSELLQKRGLSLERLHSFIRIAEAGGITRAAGGDEKEVAKMSRQLGQLEAFFGVDLMLRTGKGMELTDSGQELLRIVRHDLRLLEDFRVKCAGQPGVIRIAAGNSVIHWHLAPALGEIAKRLPGMRIEMRALRTFERVPVVRDLECDFAIVRRDAMTPKLKGKPLLSVSHRLVAHRDLLARVGIKETSQLPGKLPLALPPEGDFRLHLNRAAARHGVDLNVMLHVTSFTMATRAARTGQFAAILPHIAAGDFAEEEFAVLPLPLLGTYAQHLQLCWNPAAIRVSQSAAAALPALVELLRTDA